MKRLTSRIFHSATVKRRRLLVNNCCSWFSTTKMFASRKGALDALKIPPNSSEAQIKKAYLDLAMQWHPDRQLGKTEREQEVAKVQFDKVKTAFEYLQENTAESEAKEKRQAWSERMAQRPWAMANKTGGGKNMHFGKAPPTDRGESTRVHEDYTAERKRAEQGIPSTGGSDWTLKYEGWGRMIFAIGVACLMYLALQNERARTRYMKRTYKGKGDNQYTEIKETVSLPMDNQYVSDLASGVDLEATRQATGVQPLRTGRGWDWTPVAVAGAKQRAEAHATDLKETQLRIKEHQLKQQKKKRLIKKIKKLDQKNQALKDEIASLKAQIERERNQR